MSAVFSLDEISRTMGVLSGKFELRWRGLVSRVVGWNLWSREWWTQYAVYTLGFVVAEMDWYLTLLEHLSMSSQNHA